jgi:hypothetical protein
MGLTYSLVLQPTSRLSYLFLKQAKDILVSLIHHISRNHSLWPFINVYILVSHSTENICNIQHKINPYT